MKRHHSQFPAKAALTAIESETAGKTFVWVVWWEVPDKSWESLCLSLAESETEYAGRQSDHLLQHWGKVGKPEQQNLLMWLDNHLRADPASAETFVNPAREILRRVAAGECGPVIVSTW